MGHEHIAKGTTMKTLFLVPSPRPSVRSAWDEVKDDVAKLGRHLVCTGGYVVLQDEALMSGHRRPAIGFGVCAVLFCAKSLLGGLSIYEKLKRIPAPKP